MSDQVTPSTEVLFPRWLIVVRRDQNTLYENLVLTFKFNDRVDVLVDRRATDVRSSPQPIKSERRRRLTAKERALWKHVGFRVIYIAGDRGVPVGDATGARARLLPRSVAADVPSQMGEQERTSS